MSLRRPYLCLAALIAAVLCCRTLAQTLPAPYRFRVMSYNVENLFDCRHDSLRCDTDFLPQGAYAWSPTRYRHKLNSLAKVIAAVAQQGLPSLVGLCEVENDSVLHHLTRTSALRALDYRYLMTQSPDVRGVDVALLYQPGHFRPLWWRQVQVPSVQHGFAPTRNLLYVCGRTMRGDTVHVVVCHLPSRRGGTLRADRHRALAVSVLTELVDSVYRVQPHALLLAMGDMNLSAGQKLFGKKGLGAAVWKGQGAVGDGCRLLSLPVTTCAGSVQGVQGSYRYRGLWETIDHILLSPAWLSHPAWQVEPALQVVALPFMCRPEPTYGGVCPWRTYLGPHYAGGISDHFPVVVTLGFSL